MMAMTMTGMSPTELDLRRERALSIVPRVSGSLSMLGSIIVALKVIQNIRKGNGKSYSYIILTMCAIDFCSSLAFAFSTLPMEQGMARKFGQSYRYGAQGTEGTCKAQAFFIQFGITIIFLNFFLSLHYLFVVRWRMREEQLRKYVFRGIIVVLLIGAGLSVTPLALDAFTYNPVWCWIGVDREKCRVDGLSQSECIARAHQRRNFLYFFPLWTMVGLTTIVQVILVWTVFQTFRKARKWRMAHHHGGSGRRTSTIKSLKRREKRAEREIESTKRVAVQSFLYLASFYIAWIPWIIASNVHRNVDNILEDNASFWLALAVTTFQPLQGFLNCLAYFHAAITNHCRRVDPCSGCIKQRDPIDTNSDAMMIAAGLQAGDRSPHGGRQQGHENESGEPPRASQDFSVDSTETHHTPETDVFAASEFYSS